MVINSLLTTCTAELVYSNLRSRGAQFQQTKPETERLPLNEVSRYLIFFQALRIQRLKDHLSLSPGICGGEGWLSPGSEGLNRDELKDTLFL